MGSKFIASDATINTSVDCIHDSTTGYSADFSVNGEVDGWEYFDGIHTYGCWGGFLFGTLYGDYGTIGRYNIFRSVNATTHYFVRLVMKYNPWPRDDRGNHPLPTQGKIRWRTLQSTNWDDDKELTFDIEADNEWHTYIINMGIAQFWQGDVNDLRIWPATTDGQDGDEFFIRAIEIFSTESHECRNVNCEKFEEYSHPCPWIGLRATIESASHEEGKVFNIEDLSEFIVNINGYGNEVVKLKELSSANGREVANLLAKSISRTNIGGYAEIRVDYTDDNTFKIYTGTAHDDSTIEIINNSTARYLKFFASNNTDISTITAGETPVDGYSPLSSFKIKTRQALGLLDNDTRTAITFNPFQYSVEGGRRDWLNSSIGIPSVDVGSSANDYGGQTIRKYHAVLNEDKTVIDYNHPFNASGRIKKIWVQCTLDNPLYSKSSTENDRKDNELSGAKVLIIRPKRNGLMEVIYEWDLNDRDPNRNYDTELYSITQEVIDLDVDVFINKGDLIGVYNANIYVGKSITGVEIDAQYYQVSGKPDIGEIFDPGRLYGDGSSGLLMYANGEEPQKRLYLDIDLGNRYNIDTVEVNGQALNSILEYNVARCLDINWQCELFGHQHWTHHTRIDLPGDFWYQRPNTYYGLENLNDGVYVVPDGLACDSFSLTYNLSGANYNYEAGPGVIPVNPRYFWINGDEEWLAIWLHATYIHGSQSAHDFDEDPVAIYLHFPFEKEKKIYKSKIYFKEKHNFRSFALSTYGGAYYTLGDADDEHYDLVPEYTHVIIDNVDYYEGSPTYNNVAEYLFKNPTTGHPIMSATSAIKYEWDPVLSQAIEDFSSRSGYGQESGYFSNQAFTVLNDREYITASKVDWQILEHQWEPITCKGWRIYTDFHKSTKITEMELYCVAEDIGSNLSGGIVMTYSDYEEIWWPTESVQKSTSNVEIHIGDSPRYLRLELIPVTETRYEDIIINVKTEDVYAGTKGCEYVVLADSAKIGADNSGQVVTVKNVYGNPYDLYIDIAPDKLIESGLVFYSELNGVASILNPVIGADARYYKLPNYPLENQDYNCAINCHTYGLKNLIDGATAHYSHNDMLNWSEHGPLTHGDSIDFYNLPDSSKTTIVLPTLSRSRYWKFGLSDPDTSMNVREMRAYDVYGNQLDPEYYHDLDKTWTDGPANERAPHLENISIVGSYYTLAEDQYITADLGASVPLGRIELWHDGISDYVNFQRTVIPYSGIDKYTKMCLRSWKDNTGSYLQDVSYYEHSASMLGSTHIDTGTDDGNVSIYVDMGCLTSLTEWAEKTDYPYPKDLTPEGTWFNPVSASGTVTSGTCEFPGYVDFNVRCHAIGNDRFYYDLRDGENPEAYKLFQQMPFELTFEIQIDDYYPGGRDGAGGTYDDKEPILSVGIINGRRRIKGAFFSGVQMTFDPMRGRFGLAVRTNPPFTINYYSNNIPNQYTNTTTTGLTLGQKYYCKLTCYGGDNDHRDTDSILYRAEVWTDAIDGTNRIVNLTRDTSYYWEADNIAIGGGDLYDRSYDPSDGIEGCGSVKGTVYDLRLTVDHDVKNYPFRDEEVEDHEKASIRIPAGDNNYVKVENSTQLDVKHRYHTHDFWVKFRSLPEAGERWPIMEQYDYDAVDEAITRGWRLSIYNSGTYIRWEWWVNQGASNGYSWYLAEYNGQTGYSRYVNHFNIVKDKWYFMVFSTGKQYGGSGFFRYAFLDIDGRAGFDSSYPGNPASMFPIPPSAPIIIGKGGFDGWICEARISRGDNDLSSAAGGNRYSTSASLLSANSMWQTPIKPYVRMYPFTFYVSDTNETYGHYANVDAQFNVSNTTYLPYLYYDGDNKFAAKYNTYFAIDLGHRYDIDLVRRYGSDDDQMIDIAANVIYSNIDTDDPYTAFMTEPAFDVDDDFYGWEEYIDRDRWYLDSAVVGNENGYLKMKNGRLEHRVDSSHPSIKFYSTFGLRADFEIEIKVGRISADNTNSWSAYFRVDLSNEVRDDYTDTNSSQTYVAIRIYYESGTKIESIFCDGGSITRTSKSISSAQINNSRIKIIRAGHHFYTEYYEDGAWVEGEDRPVYDAIGKDVYRIQIALESITNYPTAKVYWRDFKVNSADRVVMRSNNNDARWMAVELLDGDGADRYINKLGIYPDITNYVSPDNYNYNHSWVDLGPSVTGYSTGVNVALGADVTTSSQVGNYITDYITDGLITNGTSKNWLSDNEGEQWILIDLGEEKEIYRVKIYHGYSDEDSDFLAEDYRIESSTDNQTFTTQWTISNNSSFTRTHDKADPFTARYIRMYITDYKADGAIYVKEENNIDFYEWKGTSVREIEVYEYYGYSYVSSEEWPIVAINLRDQFYILGHELTGLFTENDVYDWDNDSSNWAWSDDVEQDPQKISFGSFGGSFGYEQWAVIKRDTATYYNISVHNPPIDPNQQAYGIDYLKHAIIKSTTKENPVDYPWWWSSNISTLSRDYDKEVEMSTSSLKIEYPASTAIDTVQFIEGSDWGVDSDFAFRDGLYFRWYIEDSDKLDISEGYVFFGGYDGTPTAQPVEYRWYLSTLSGANVLQTGWNKPFFRIKDADEAIYNENADDASFIQPEIPEYTTWQTWGIKFKGKGEAFTMNIDGGAINRNIFEDSSKFDYGLYLAGSDYFEVPVSDLDLKAGTIEFWMRPDYSFVGVDIHKRIKNRSIFHLGNVANDVFGFMINARGLNLYYGNVATDLRAMLVQEFAVGAVDALFHVAVAFSSNGSNIGGDNSSIKLYINNSLVATNYDTWTYTDEKFWKFTVGGKAPLAVIEDASSLQTTSIDSVVSNLRIYNYCKNDFTDSMANTFSENGRDLVVPSKMIEISQDNVTYYKVGDPELPFFYEKVPADDTVQVYVRSLLPNDLTGQEDRTAGIVTSWDIGV